MNQEELFLPPAGDGKRVLDTQLDGYEKAQENLGERQGRVLGVIRSSGEVGATLFELCAFLNLPVNSVSGRVTELVMMGKVKDSGKRKRNPASGVNGVVWVAS